MGIVIRTDGNSEIGSGHIGRCSAIAAAAVAQGMKVRFAVSDVDSANVVLSRSFDASVLGGDPQHFAVADAERLASFASGDSILVDSYAATDAFFLALREAGCKVAYIDDLYTFADGFASEPRRLLIDWLINYSFGVGLQDYSAQYGDAATELLVGPQYAPVRSAFAVCAAAYEVSREIKTVLVTSGSTNPDKTLERMAEGCLAILPGATVQVVVGPMAEFDQDRFVGHGVQVIEGAKDLSAFMTNADLVISAAGTTLYELAAIGVPTIALPIVANQLANVRGVAKLGLAPEAVDINWHADDVARLVSQMLSQDQRLRFHHRMHQVVDGTGAAKIAAALE